MQPPKGAEAAMRAMMREYPCDHPSENIDQVAGYPGGKSRPNFRNIDHLLRPPDLSHCHPYFYPELSRTCRPIQPTAETP